MDTGKNPKVPRYDVVLWDVDGTLMDFKRAERESLGQCLREIGAAPSEELLEMYSRINISYWKRLEKGELTKDEVLIGRFREFLSAAGIESSPEKLLWQYEEGLSRTWFIQDDSLALCLRLKAAGIRQYVVTNGWSFVQKRKLEASGFNDIMEDSFISDDLGFPKPRKAFFEACFQKIFGTAEPEESDRKRALIVGDSLTSDMQGGINAGIDCCWYQTEDEDAKGMALTYTIHSLWEILDILGL